MKRISLLFFVLLSIIFSILFFQNKNKHVCPRPDNLVTYNPIDKFEGEPEENNDIQVPIPMKDRVPNITGIQCVWSSVETLARYAELEKLYDIIKEDEYKSYSGPDTLKRMLQKYKVKYEMTTNKNDRSLILKGCVKERRGVGFDIPGHVMVLVHYDEINNVVKYINNSDKTLKIRVWTMEEFNKRWAGWVFIIYADKDIIPIKYSKTPSLEVIDKNNQQGKYHENYVFPPFMLKL